MFVLITDFLGASALGHSQSPSGNMRHPLTVPVTAVTLSMTKSPREMQTEVPTAFSWQQDSGRLSQLMCT